MLGTSLSIKGQVTIPKNVRDSLGLKIGDRVAFVPDGDKAILVPMKGDFWKLKGILKGRTKGEPLSLKSMNSLAKKRVTERYKSHRHGDL